jgi:glutathione S-transferase
MLKVHGVGASPFVRKVRVALAEKGIDYELNPVMPFAVSEEFRRISPLGKIPVLETEDCRYVNDSSVICDYLERTHPKPALYPTDHYERARALWFEEYGDTAVVGAVGTVFFQKVVGPAFMNQPTDEKILDNAWTVECPKVFSYLEGQIRSADEPLVGDAFSIADIATATFFVNLFHAGFKVPEHRWPKLAGFIERVHARPTFKALIDEEQQLFGALTR